MKLDDIATHLSHAVAAVQAATDLATLKALRIQNLGRSGLS